MGRDLAEFSDFVVARWPALLRTAYLLTGDYGHAEDVVQTALSRSYSAWPRMSTPAAAESYVRKAMLTTYLSWRRKRSWSELPSDRTPERGNPDPTDEVVQRSLLMEALATLPPRQRAVVVLRFYEDLGVARVAEQLGCAPGTVKRQTSEALAKLRIALGETAELVEEHVVTGGEGRS